MQIASDESRRLFMWCAWHAHFLRSESLLRTLARGTVSRKQLHLCERMWEGSWMQNSDPRNTNRIEGDRGWVSQPHMVKPDTCTEDAGVNPAGLEGKRPSLPREICASPVLRASACQQPETLEQKSAEAILACTIASEGPNRIAKAEPRSRE